jgi:hypothetical protein
VSSRSSNISVADFEVSGHPVMSGAYIEVFERGGRMVGRMNFFDSDTPRGPKELRAFHRALGRAIKVMEEKTDAPTPEPVSLEALHDMLCRVMGKAAVPMGHGYSDNLFEADYNDVPKFDTLEQLTQEEREEVMVWARDCHIEASDNDVKVGPCPEPLRSRLPDDHRFKTWRVE